MERGKIDAEAELSLPPGFRFHPTDEELVVHYLCRKAAHQRLPVPIIADVDLYKYDPWDLPERALFGQREWYFFTPRDRKYPNGSRPNRAAGRGYWKATGADKPVSTVGPTDRPIAIKKALVFYHGKAPKGVKTDWIMHEYRLANVNRAATNKKGSLRLDEWVLCRLYNKKNSWEKKAPLKREATETMETSEDTRSESLRTPESDVDHDHHEQFPDFHDMGNLQYFPAAASNVMEAPKSNGFPRLGQVKEDSDWFVGLQLDDLQSSLMDFGSSDDYYFPALDSPHLMPPL